MQEITETVVETTITEFEQPLYKQWFRTSSAAGFLSITPWLVDKTNKPVGKVIIEIGSIAKNNSVESATKCYVDAIDLAVYLRAVLNGTAPALYPKRSGVNSPEGFIVFGGTPGTTPIARVFKTEYWGGSGPNQEAVDPNARFVWKCGHFEGTVSDSGAIQPNYSKPVSGNMIMRTRLQMAEISYRLDLCLNGWAARTAGWYGN